MEAAAYTDGKMGTPQGQSAYVVQKNTIGSVEKHVPATIIATVKQQCVLFLLLLTYA
jgi:hypothetical protein